MLAYKSTNIRLKQNSKSFDIDLYNAFQEHFMSLQIISCPEGPVVEAAKTYCRKIQMATTVFEEITVEHFKWVS